MTSGQLIIPGLEPKWKLQLKREASSYSKQKGSICCKVLCSFSIVNTSGELFTLHHFIMERVATEVTEMLHPVAIEVSHTRIKKY